MSRPCGPMPPWADSLMSSSTGAPFGVAADRHPQPVARGARRATGRARQARAASRDAEQAGQRGRRGQRSPPPRAPDDKGRSGASCLASASAATRRHGVGDAERDVAPVGLVGRHAQPERLWITQGDAAVHVDDDDAVRAGQLRPGIRQARRRPRSRGRAAMASPPPARSAAAPASRRRVSTRAGLGRAPSAGPGPPRPPRWGACCAAAT